MTAAVTARLSSGNVKYYVGSAVTILNNAADNLDDDQYLIQFSDTELFVRNKTFENEFIVRIFYPSGCW